MIFTKYDTYTGDEQVEKLNREFNIHYRACIGSLIYLLSTKLYLSFVVQKIETFSSNRGKVHCEVLEFVFNTLVKIRIWYLSIMLI